MAIQQSDIQSGLAELSKLTNDELKQLLNSPSDEKYDEIVNQSDKVKGLEAEREMLMASVRSLAEFNLARQGDYESERSKLLTLVGDSNKLKEEIQQKASKLLELSRKTSLETTLAVVLAATAHAEEESEEIAQKFIANTLDYDTFISQYCEKRKLAHLRRIKADRLRQETDESWTGIRTQSFGHLSQ